MKSKLIKYGIGFAVFLGFFVAARIIENKVSAFSKLTNIGS
jgi:hypothetical protein